MLKKSRIPKCFRTPEFKKLNDEWQQRLEDSGFDDDERVHEKDKKTGKPGKGRTIDYNETEYTMERDRTIISLDALTHPTSGDQPENWETLIQDEQASLTDGYPGDIVSVWDLPQAKYFRAARQALDRLPADYPRLSYLREYVETGVHRDADMLHRHRITDKAARWAVKKFEKLMRKPK